MASQTFAAPSEPEAAASPTDLPARGADLRSVRFPARTWGYERRAVDAYVARVCAFVDDALALRRPEGAVRDALARVGEETSAVLQRATEVAEDITARSRTQADDRRARAEREATAIREAAEAQARELEAETEHLWQERARLIADIECIADELSALAGAASARGAAPVAEDGQETAEANVLDDDFLLDDGEPEDGKRAVGAGEVPSAGDRQTTRVLPDGQRD